MRRSSAPSARNKNPLIPVKVCSRSILTNNATQSVTTVSPANTSTTFFNVVWGKRSSKKHKTWEGDGTLEVALNKNATLRDNEGKYLGSTTVKPEELGDGARLIIGSNEVEIVDQLATKPQYDRKRAEKCDEEQVENKKPKNYHISTPVNLQLVKNTTNKMNFAFHSSAKKTIDDNFEPLVMHEPSEEHQKQLNTENCNIIKVSVIGCLAKHLRPHQRIGVSFLYDCLMGYRNIDHCGCILADEMGLGKTLQTITACYTMLKQSPYGRSTMRKILIVTPSSLVDNWNQEINKWLSTERVFTFQLDAKHTAQQFASTSNIPFLLISYEMFVSNIEDLKNIRFDIIICDEGHRLKNNLIRAAVLLNEFDCKKRVILTGTPIQNDLQEFFSLCNFVNPGFFGSYQEFKNKFETPITRSQQPDASEDVSQFGIEQAKILTEITSTFILRRTQSVLRQYLPAKHDLVVFCKPSELQEVLLKTTLEYYENCLDNVTKKGMAFQIIAALRKICSHPSLIQTISKTDPLIDYLKDVLPPWQEMGPFDSGKLLVLYNMLHAFAEKKEKLVLISHHTKTLDMIQGLLEHFSYTFCRLDGSTQAVSRNKIVQDFNDKTKGIFVFLLSAKAGGIGLNLVGASRLVLFDNDWNPAADAQAMSRIWRDGQTNDVYIYRLITAGTVEEKVFQRQMSKVSLGACIIDVESTKENLKLSDEDLKDLFTHQDDKSCGTHDMLNCKCFGDGQNILNTNPQEGETSRINDLSHWRHFKEPINQEFLQEFGMPNTSEEIAFIFANSSKNNSCTT